MSDNTRILVGAGDVGGARALLPGLRELEKRGRSFDLIDHGFIVTEAPADWTRVALSALESRFLKNWKETYAVYVFGSSVTDTVPLRVARRVRSAGLPTVCVLDNWMGYRKRLEMDGQESFWPDIYGVMDELARVEAIADGVPATCLRVIGQPAVAGLADEFRGCEIEAEKSSALERSGWAVPGKKLVVFISEPVAKDQGANPDNPLFRGYTEKTVLRLLADCLQPFVEAIQVGLVPHPRENPFELDAHWQVCRGRLTGGRLATDGGRKAVFVADGVCGMASLLLYEGLLLGKPVLSLQPSLRLSQLEFLRKKGVNYFVTRDVDAAIQIGLWVKGLCAPLKLSNCEPLHAEFKLHQASPMALADLIEEAAERSQLHGRN